jgi:opacity protein-like surface antigen
MRAVRIALLAAVLPIAVAAPAQAEWYVAGMAGPTFGDRISNVEGTGPSLGAAGPDFDLKNSIMYGAKVGYFPGHGWGGLEVEAFNTTPHLKQLRTEPGIHLRVTTIALNFIARYPGTRVQPYVGVGVGVFASRLAASATTASDSDVRTGLNFLAGIRCFMTPYVSLFTEYKLTQATLRYDNAFGAAGGFIGDYTAQHIAFGVAYHF